MTHISTYPVIVTNHFSETVAFYEDNFTFSPCYETDGYVRMCCPDTKKTLLVIISATHPWLPGSLPSTPGNQIMTFVTDRFDAIYDSLYHEGLKILQEPTEVEDGFKYFMVADPNNEVVINVLTAVEPDAACGTILHTL